MKKSYNFIIEGRLDGLNEYTRANRTNRYAGGHMKSKNEEIVSKAIEAYLERGNLAKNIAIPIEISIDWYEPNNRRDIDNVIFAQKFILDALIRNGIIEDDNRNCIIQLTHRVFTDKDNPRIEVTLYQV